jgi:hypothetical protein
MTAPVSMQYWIRVRAVRHRGVNISGRNAIYADSGAAQVIRKRAGKAENSGLRSQVCWITGKPELRGQGTDKYDSPFLNTAIGHAIGEMARPPKWSLQVDVDRDLPIRVSLGNTGTSDPGIVDEVNRATFAGERLLEGCFNDIFVKNITLNRVISATGGNLDEIDTYDAVPALVKFPSDGKPVARGRSGDDACAQCGHLATSPENQ